MEDKQISIQKISKEKALQIIEERRPCGNFYLKEDVGWTAIDNTHGAAITEDFETLEQVLAWFEDPNAIAEEIREKYGKKEAKMKRQFQLIEGTKMLMVSESPVPLWGYDTAAHIGRTHIQCMECAFLANRMYLKDDEKTPVGHLVDFVAYHLEELQDMDSNADRIEWFYDSIY